MFPVCAIGSVELAQDDTAQEGDYEAPVRPQAQNPNPAANPDPVPASRRRSMQSLADIVAASQRAERSGLPPGAAGVRGMSLPFTPLCLTFRELSYYVALPKVRQGKSSESGSGQGLQTQRIVQKTQGCRLGRRTRAA